MSLQEQHSRFQMNLYKIGVIVMDWMESYRWEQRQYQDVKGQK